MRIGAVVSAVALLALAGRPTLGQDAQADGLRLRVSNATLTECVQAVAAVATEIQYVVWEGDEQRLSVDLLGRTPDDLMDSVAQAFGAQASVVGGLWIVEGCQPNAWRVDLWASVAEALEPHPAVRAALAERVAGAGPPPGVGALYRGLLADLQVPVGLPAGRCRSIGVRVEPESSAYGPLYAALLQSAVESSAARPLPDWTPWSIRIVDGALTPLCMGRLLPERGLRLGGLQAEDGLVLWPTHTAWHGGAWEGASPLSTRVSLDTDGRLSEALNELAARTGVGISLGQPELDGALAVRLRDVPAGSALVAISAAAGLPSEDVSPTQRQSVLDAEEYVLGGPPGLRCWYASQSMDDRLARYVRPETELASLVAGLTDEERAALAASAIAVQRLAPRLRHAACRWLRSGLSPSAPSLDYLLARIARPLDLCVFVSGTGDVMVAIKLQEGHRRDTHVGRIGDDGLGAAPTAALRGVGGPSVDARLVHWYSSGPRDLVRGPFRGDGGGWTLVCGPVPPGAEEGG